MDFDQKSSDQPPPHMDDTPTITQPPLLEEDKSWIQKLGDDEWIGATDLIIDPRDPKILYAATWQRHRTVAGYMGGGPGSNIYKSMDGGDTWKKIDKGLPKSNMGKIG